jgi:hypothetical protein
MSDNVDIIRQLMSATVIDTKFLKGLQTLWRDELAPTAWQWLYRKCNAYLNQYGSAPGRNIETIWAAEPCEEETRADLEKLLSELSEEYESQTEPKNTDLLLAEAQRYFATEQYADLAARLEAAADTGDVTKADKLLAELKPVRLPLITAVNPFMDPEGMKAALASPWESLVELGGAFQEQVGSQIISDSFVGLLGEKKAGKTFLLQALMFGGLRKGTNVLYVQAGDLSEGQQKLRFAIELTGRNNRSKYNRAMLSPVPDCELNQKDTCDRTERISVTGCIAAPGKPYPLFKSFAEIEVDYRPCTNCFACRPSSWWERIDAVPDLTESDIDLACARLYGAVGDRLRFLWFPQGGATVAKIDTAMRIMYETTGWKARLVLGDYPDIFGMEPGAPSEKRLYEEARWSAGRKMAQDWQCGVVWPTQSNRERHKGRLLVKRNISEADMKLAHVTAFFALNKDDHDRKRGWLRISPLVMRDEDYNGMDQVTLLQCLQRGLPNLASFWWKRAEEEEF